jgi:signal transduction histidine kinase
MVPRSPLYFAGVVLLSAVYALVAKAALSLDAIQGFATLVWPPTGIALAAAIRFGYGIWPGVAIGALAANLWQGAPASAATGIAFGNTAEALLGAYLLRRAHFRPSFDRLSDVATFVGLGALFVPLVSATVGPLSLSAAKVIPIDRLLETSLAWWVGDAGGALVVGSLLLVWSSPRPSSHAPASAVEVTALSSLFTVAAVVPMVGPAAARSVAFLVFPLLIWAAVRFGQRGATSATAFVSAAAIVDTALGYGPFASGRLQERLLTMQAYVIVIAVTLLVLGAVTEEWRRALAALRRALDAREEFLSIASHELKTPLSSMVLNLTGLQRTLRRGEQLAPDAVGRKVQRVVKQAGRLTALINQLLDVSRISSNTFELVREDIDLHELARDVCSRFAEEAKHRGSRISITGAASLRGRWDRLRLEQVLSNLLSNAIRYGEGRPIEVSLERRGDLAVLFVRDEGRGMEPGALPGIFDRFNSSKAARRFGGLGLGLYISQQIVKEHGGAIRAASAVGKGSTFTVEIPLAITTAQEDDEPDTDRPPLDGTDDVTKRDTYDPTHPDHR